MIPDPAAAERAAIRFRGLVAMYEARESVWHEFAARALTLAAEAIAYDTTNPDPYYKPRRAQS